MKDDLDMKIVGDDLRLPTSEAQPDLTPQLLEQHAHNGNLDRAKRLGGLLAGQIAATDGNDVLLKTLLTFAAEMGLRLALPVPLVQETAVVALYDTLQQAVPELYREIQTAGDFSFYHLAAQGATPETVGQKVGEMYASLRARQQSKDAAQDPPADSASWAEYGAKAYNNMVDNILRTAQSMGFIWE